MSTNSSSTGNGISIESLLGVLFVGLKLTGFINWPWVWVLAPFWIPVVIGLVILVIASIIYLINK